MPTFDSIRPKVFRAYCDIITPGTSTVVLCPRQQYRNVCKISIRPEQSVMVNALIMSAPFPPYVRLTFPFLTEVPVRPGADCSKACNNIAALQPKTQRAFANIIRKTKRFAIPERAVYFLKTKRTAGGTPPPQNIFDRLTPVFT